MRRFIEEITVRDPEIARKIILALEGDRKKEEPASSSNATIAAREPVYEVDLYEEGDFELRSNGPRGMARLKIFVREDR